MGLDYYGILQIQRTSTTLDIKKAYRNLALEFHRDKLADNQGANQKVFALIGEAYDVLSDALKRAVFDQYGEEGLKRGVPGPDGYIQPYRYHGDPMLTYKDFFGTTSPYANLLDYLQNPPEVFCTNGTKGYPKKQPPVRHPLCLSLHELYFGGVKKMKVHRLVFVNDEKSRTDVREKILTIGIKPGLQTGTEIRFVEEGDQNPTQIPADIIFVVDERPHEIFQRINDDLLMPVEISLEEALTGTTVEVNTIDRRTIRIPITDVIYPGYEKVVENEGMPILEKYPERGNLIIRFSIQFPNYLPKVSRDLVKKSFHLAEINQWDVSRGASVNKLVLANKICCVERSEQLPPS